jgi:hypothetical protein
MALKRFLHWINGTPLPRRQRLEKRTGHVCATMLAGGHRGEVARLGLESLRGWIDSLVLVDSGTADDVISVARELFPAEMVHVVPYQCADFDCATARNLALDGAASIGADVAVHLDTDEAFVGDCQELRRQLLDPRIDCWEMFDACRSYTKCRAIRLPAKGEWLYPVHEDYVGGGITHGLIVGCAFTERQKSPEEEMANARAIEAKCQEWLRSDPCLARPHLHLAIAIAYQRRFAEAIPHYERYVDLSDGVHEKAWGLLSIATCYGNQGDARSAISACARGAEACPSLPEFQWYAAVQYLQLNRPREALDHADMAIALGYAGNNARVMPLRLGFQLPISQWEGGWQVREVALRVLGYDELANDAARMAEKAQQARLDWKG